MSVYKNDNPTHFIRAIKSITTEQTVMPDEIVLVVDGPIGEELKSVIEKIRVECNVINVIYLSENVGLGNALKIALDNCTNELVARMDSDDVSLPNRFELQLKYFAENPEVDIVGGDISEFIGDETNIVAYRRVPTSNEDIYVYMKKRCPFNHMSVMYKKSVVEHAGGYLDLFWNEDYYLWIRLAENSAVMANTGEVLVNVRTGEDMYMRRGGKRYFESERFLQRYMLQKKMISRLTYTSNVFKRWLVQRVMPNSVRGWVFRNLARKRK